MQRETRLRSDAARPVATIGTPEMFDGGKQMQMRMCRSARARRSERDRRKMHRIRCRRPTGAREHNRDAQRCACLTAGKKPPCNSRYFQAVVCVLGTSIMDVKMHTVTTMTLAARNLRKLYLARRPNARYSDSGKIIKIATAEMTTRRSTSAGAELLQLVRSLRT